MGLGKPASVYIFVLHIVVRRMTSGSFSSVSARHTPVSMGESDASTVGVLWTGFLGLDAGVDAGVFIAGLSRIQGIKRLTSRDAGNVFPGVCSGGWVTLCVAEFPAATTKALLDTMYF